MIHDLDNLTRTLAVRQRRVLPEAMRGRAAVMVALYGDGPDYQVLYTVRTSKVEHHKGEISFPGGACDPEDAGIAETALRESLEEVGIQPADVSILGLLDDMVTGSQFTVTPVVARVKAHPYNFSIHEFEVDKLLQVPLSHLNNATNHVPHPRAGTNSRAYKFGDHVIFGATASMTTHFLGLAIGTQPVGSQRVP